MPLTRRRVTEALQAHVEAELHAVERVAAMARDEATSGETRQEGKYDTRATEASYLARGQAARVRQLRQLAAWCAVQHSAGSQGDTVEVGAVVEIRGPATRHLFLAPVGGATLQVDGVKVQVISPSSPLGQAMMGLESEDEFDARSPRGQTTWEIVRVD